ncbi:hypothetical protein KAU43_03105 [candidate division WOR-3 bacterium]|jgi:hypothetical protein|nr:hypothetical protein [candidate division WOR-3 bacterium]
MDRYRVGFLILMLFLSLSVCGDEKIAPNDVQETFSDTALFSVKINPISNFKGEDIPNDAGQSIGLSWEVSDDKSVNFYKILRSENPDGPFNPIVQLTSKFRRYNDRDDIKDKKDYYYKIIVMDNEVGAIESDVYGPYKSYAQWFNKKRGIVLFLALLFGFFILYYMKKAKKDPNMFIRRISGLDALDDAVGRSTEMGKPIMYILGIGEITDLPTLAGLNILGDVAEKAFEYGSSIRVPCYDPVVMTTAQEVVKQSAYAAGRPDAFNKSDIMYITKDQFGYAAGCDGMMMREEPGAIFLQGTFYAEALILAETGHSVGAIQIAGTTMTHQLPFFIAACDYTLIGEEMLAASAYLSKDPDMVGTIKGEDAGKLIILLFILIMVLMGTLGYIFHISPIIEIFNAILALFTQG